MLDPQYRLFHPAYPFLLFLAHPETAWGSIPKLRTIPQAVALPHCCLYSGGVRALVHLQLEKDTNDEGDSYAFWHAGYRLILNGQWNSDAESLPKVAGMMPTLVISPHTESRTHKIAIVTFPESTTKLYAQDLEPASDVKMVSVAFESPKVSSAVPAEWAWYPLTGFQHRYEWQHDNISSSQSEQGSVKYVTLVIRRCKSKLLVLISRTAGTFGGWK